MNIKARLLGPAADGNPYPVYARIREEAPVSQVQLRDDVRCWVVSRYADARAALADPRLSRDPRSAGPAWRAADRGRPLEDGAGLGVHLLTREPPEHTRLRRLVAQAFAARRAADLRGRVRGIAHALIDQFADRGQAELIASFAYPLPIIVISELLGIPSGDRDYFRQWTSNAVSANAPGPGGYLRDLVAEKRKRPGDDLISALVAAQGAGWLNETELLSMIFLLIIAGHENTTALIGNGILALLGNPDQLAVLRQRPGLINAAVEEVLRYDGPMELAAWRFATEPVTISGVLIPAGEPVVIALAAAHRDPAQFREADRFTIGRTDHTHLAFGYGIHYCLGAPLARLEGAVALDALIRRLPGLDLAIPVERIPRQPSSIVRGLHELPVTFTPSTSLRSWARLVADHGP